MINPVLNFFYLNFSLNQISDRNLFILGVNRKQLIQIFKPDATYQATELLYIMLKVI